MIGVFFESLFTGRIIFLILFGLFGGMVIGHARVGWLGLIFWVPVMLFCQFLILLSSAYLDGLMRIGSTGSAGFSVGSVIMLHLILHPTLLLLGIVIGRKSKSFEESERQQQAANIDAEGFVRMLNRYGAHPQFAVAGWFQARWNTMDEDARLTWTNDRLPGLRDLWIRGEDKALDGFGLELAQHLAAIDQGGTTR